MDATEAREYATELANDARALALADLLRLQLVKRIQVAAPAAGADWTLTVPGGVAWELLGVGSSFVTSAVVANRNPTLVITDDAGKFLGRFGSNTVVAAATTARVSFWGGLGATSGAAAINFAPLPPALPLFQGWSVASLTSALDAGDQYSGVILLVREWTAGQIYYASDLLARDLSFEAQRERRA